MKKECSVQRKDASAATQSRMRRQVDRPDARPVRTRPITSTRRRKIALAVSAGLVAAMAAAAPAQAAVKSPRLIESFHGINYVGIHGFPANTDVLTEIVRGTTVIGHAKKRTDSTGFYELNHVGGGDCFDTPTPDILPGDVIQTQVLTNPTDTDSMTVQDIFRSEAVVDRTAGVIRVTGHVRVPGTTTPLDNVEVRLNHPGGTWDAPGANNRRDWRVAGQIAPNGSFVAEFAGGSAADLDNVATAELAAEFGNADLTEITVYDGLSDGPCGAATTTAITNVAPGIINAAGDGLVTVSGLYAPSGVNGITVDGVDATLEAATGTWSAQLDLAGRPEGTIDLPVVYTGAAAPAAQTATVRKDTVAPGPVSSDFASGTYVGAQTIHLTGENQVRYTTDGSTPTPTSQPYSGAINVTSTRTIKALAIDAAGNPGPVSSFAYTITGPTASSAQPRTVTNTVVQQVPVAGAVAGIKAGSPSPARLSLTGLSMRRTIARGTVRANGLSAVMGLKRDTKVLRIRIYRKNADGTRSLVAERFLSPAATGRYRARLKDRRLRQALTPGSYETQVAPGRSRSALGGTSKFAFRVTR
jgi:hypothetical protein